jgi:two-component sensor histidine kinase
MKNIRLFLLLLLLSGALPAMAQIRNPEELPLPDLKEKLTESKADTGKVQLEIALGRAYLFKPGGGKKEVDSSQLFADEAAKLSRQLSYNDGTVNAMLLSALILNKKNNPDAGLKMAQQALAYAQSVNDNRGMAEAYIIIGQHYNIAIRNDLFKRIDYYNKAISIFREDKAMLRLATTLKDEAELLFLADKKTDAIKLLFDALNINKAIGYKRVEGIYWLIGRTSTELGDSPSALEYNTLAVKVAKEVKDTTLQLCSIYTATSEAYLNINDLHNALYYASMALQIAKRYNDLGYYCTISILLAYEYTRLDKLPRALAMLNEIKKYADNDENKLIISSNFLRVLTYAKQYGEAAPYAQEVQGLLEKIPPDLVSNFLPAYNYLSEYYVATRQLKPAYIYTDRYAAISHEINYALGIRSAEKRYYQLDSLKGDFKSAMTHYLASQKIKDSLDNITKAYQISLLQIANETEKKNNDIDALTKQAEKKDDQLKRNRFIQRVIIAGSVLLLIIIVLLYSRYRLKQRSNTLLLKQKSEIDEQNIALQHLVHDKNQLIGDKDDLLQEKDLLLKEVNHRVKNNLQIVMSLLGTQSGYMQNEKAQEAILESQNRVQSIALIHDQFFHTDKIAVIDLESYITELVQSLDYSLNRGGSKVAITCDIDNITLDVSQAIPVGIILNEAVTNALKYAFPGDRTGWITVMVKKDGNQYIEMQISDNGIGLPADFSLSKSNSLGITLIQGLTGQLKGTFAVENNEGVSISIRFPVETATITGKAGITTETMD